MRGLFQVLMLIGLVYAALLLFVYLYQSRLLYLPDIAGRGLVATPADIGLPFEAVHLQTVDGVKLHGWFIEAPGATRTLLFFHGNAGNISHRLDSIAIFNSLGLDVLIIDYRGYGNSEGRPSEKGTAFDALAAWRYLVEARDIRPADIVIFGRSLGAAVGVALARELKPAALILESTFTSVPEMAAALYPFLPVRWLARIHYNTLANVAAINCPVLVIHSRDDEIIPFEHGRALYAAANEPSSFIELRGGHNEGFLYSRNIYIEGLQNFLLSLD